MEQEELKILAKQLSCPEGNMGKEVSLRMNISNAGMIKSGIEAMQIFDNDYVLELGHGNANHLNEIFSLKENIRYAGLEISETMSLEACFRNQVLYAEEWVDFQLYNGEDIPFEDKIFTKILSVNTLYFWKEPQRLFNEIFRVLEDNGIFVLVFLTKETLEKLPFTQYGFRKYPMQEIEVFLKEAGFRTIECKTKKETVNSTAGNSVEREYSVLSIKK